VDARVKRGHDESWIVSLGINQIGQPLIPGPLLMKEEREKNVLVSS